MSRLNRTTQAILGFLTWGPMSGYDVKKAVEQKIIPGIPPWERRNPDEGDFSHSLLVAVHPTHTKGELDRLVEVLSHD